MELHHPPASSCQSQRLMWRMSLADARHRQGLPEPARASPTRRNLMTKDLGERAPTGPGESGDDELREAVSKNEAWAEWGGAAVVVGLIVEVVLTSAYRHGASFIEAWGPVFADALIALGVAAEILFARKARAKAESLQHRSDEKIAEANARAAEANRIAEGERLARIKLETGLASRRLTSEQSAALTSALSAIKEQVPALQVSNSATRRLST